MSRCNREVQLGDNLPGDALRVDVICQAVLQDNEACADVVECGNLFLELQDEGVSPLDVRAAVEIVADPGSNGRDFGTELVGTLAEASSCDGVEAVQEFFKGVAQIVNADLDGLVFVFQRDRAVGTMRHANHGLALHLP